MDDHEDTLRRMAHHDISHRIARTPYQRTHDIGLQHIERLPHLTENTATAQP